MSPPTRGSVTGIKQKIGLLYKDCVLFLMTKKSDSANKELKLGWNRYENCAKNYLNKYLLILI